MQKGRKTKLVQLWVPPEVLKRWKAAAEESGLSLSEWLRVRANGVDVVAQPPKAA